MRRCRRRRRPRRLHGRQCRRPRRRRRPAGPCVSHGSRRLPEVPLAVIPAVLSVTAHGRDTAVSHQPTDRADSHKLAIQSFVKSSKTLSSEAGETAARRVAFLQCRELPRAVKPAPALKPSSWWTMTTSSRVLASARRKSLRNGFLKMQSQRSAPTR